MANSEQFFSSFQFFSNFIISPNQEIINYNNEVRIDLCSLATLQVFKMLVTAMYFL